MVETLKTSAKADQIALATSLLNELTFWEAQTITPTSSPAAAEVRQPTNTETAKSTTTTWKTAIDPSSGRTYYYDSVTRQSQWEKPRELKLIEKRKKQEQRESDVAFFRAMEANLLQSLDRGELIPGWKPEVSVPTKSTSVSKRVRTISGLNEHWMVELQSNGSDRPKTTPAPTRRTRSPSPKPRLPPLPAAAAPKKETSVSDEDDDLRGVDFLRAEGHVRRNTMDGNKVSTSNYYASCTMEQPDIPATIQTVSGVLRSHIVDATRNPPRPSIFSSGNSNTVPSLEEIQEFVWEFYHRSQMEFDAIIMSLIYVERLMKETEGALTPSPDNWPSVIFSCMVLASKVWDDLSMWNIDFSNVSKSCLLATFSLQRINELERAVLQCLNFAVVIPASEYAKYYYLLRSMMIRGGLGVPTAPNQADKLQDRTSRYQNKVRSQQRRARSVDWGEPLMRETACLEQIVSR